MIKKTLLFTSLATLFSASAFAQSAFYGGVEIGRASTNSPASESFQELVEDADFANNGEYSVITGSYKQDKSANVGRIFLGYKLNENLSFEAGYNKSASFKISGSGIVDDYFTPNPTPNINSDLLLNSSSFTIAGNLSYSGLDFSTLLRPSKSTGLNNFYVRLGIHNFTAKGTVTTGDQSENIKESGMGTLLGFGYDMPINNKLDIGLGAVRYNKIAGMSDANGTVISAGLKIKF